MGKWARQQGLFKLRDTYVAYGVRGLNVSLNMCQKCVRKRARDVSEMCQEMC